MGKMMSPLFSRLFLIRYYDNIHESLDEFGIPPDPTTGFHGSRVMIGKNSVSTFSRLFFIRSFSYLQVMMTCMTALTSSSFSLIRPLTAELAVHENLKKIPIGL